MQVWNDEDTMIFERRLKHRIKAWSLSHNSDGSYDFVFVLSKDESSHPGYVYQVFNFENSTDETFNGKESFAIADFENVLENAE